MPLGPKTRAFFDKLIKEVKNKPQQLIGTLPIAQLRKEWIAEVRKYAAKLPAGVKDSDFVHFLIHLDNGHEVPIQIYTPPNLHEKILPTMIFFYGGGFCLNLIENQLGPCALIANQAQCKAIAIDYPLAPEHSALEIINTCYEVVKYLYQHPLEFNIDKEKLIIAGCSSGGTIAAVITNKSLKNKDIKIFQQILISPRVDLSLETQNNSPYLEYQKQDIMLTNEASEYFSNIYAQEMDRKSPDLSPLYCKDFANLPDTTIIVGEYDALRGDGTRYSEVLRQAGNKYVELIVCEGQTHNFFSARGVLDDGEDPAMIVVNSIKKKLTIENKLRR